MRDVFTRSPSGLEENSLGLVVGTDRRTRRPTTFRRAQRTVFTTMAQQDSLGTGYIGTGLTVVSWSLIAYEFVAFLLHVGDQRYPALTALGWLVLLPTVVLTALSVKRYGHRLPTRLYLLVILGLAVSAALDAVAVWGPRSVESPGTVSVAAGIALIGIVTTRPPRDLIGATVVLGALQVGIAISHGSEDPDRLTLHIINLVVCTAPPIIGIVVISAFRRMVQVEVDRALVQSTVSAPRFAVGMLASEELERLDLAAERLLADVADGTLSLPLDTAKAAHAATLATQLRLHLIDGRRETWLHHAVTESEFLGPFVTVEDPQGNAGLLSATQRDGLLSASWLFLSDTSGPHPRLHITIGATAPTVGARGLLLPLSISTTAVPRRRVDPATWEAIEQVGEFLDFSRNGDVYVEITCVVENPADM